MLVAKSDSPSVVVGGHGNLSFLDSPLCCSLPLTRVTSLKLRCLAGDGTQICVMTGGTPTNAPLAPHYRRSSDFFGLSREMDCQNSSLLVTVLCCLTAFVSHTSSLGFWGEPLLEILPSWWLLSSRNVTRPSRRYCRVARSSSSCSSLVFSHPSRSRYTVRRCLALIDCPRFSVWLSLHRLLSVPSSVS